MDSVYFANSMSCYIDQVRVAEVGVGPRLNPLRKPYNFGRPKSMRLQQF